VLAVRLSFFSGEPARKKVGQGGRAQLAALPRHLLQRRQQKTPTIQAGVQDAADCQDIVSRGSAVVLFDRVSVGCCQHKIHGLLCLGCGLENQPFVGFQCFKLSR